MTGKSAVRDSIQSQEAVQLGRTGPDLKGRNPGESELSPLSRAGMLKRELRSEQFRPYELFNALCVDAHSEWGNHPMGA